MSGKEGTNGSRRYRSLGGSDYNQPTHHSKGDFSGWNKTINTSDGKKTIPLEKTRYVGLREARRIVERYGRGAEAIEAVYNPSNEIDYDGLGGILLYVLPGTNKLQPSQKIEYIKPELPKRAPKTSIPPTTPAPNVGTKPATQNLGDPLLGIEELLRGTKEDSGLDLLGNKDSRQGTEILSADEIAKEIRGLKKTDKK